MLAFGKAFVVRTSGSRRPPGAELFTQAMKLLPDLTILNMDPIETIEILCCAALYLQSLDFRSSAYGIVRSPSRFLAAANKISDRASSTDSPRTRHAYEYGKSVCPGTYGPAMSKSLVDSVHG